MIRLARRIQTTHHVIRFDRRGYGKSQPHPGPYSVQTNALDVIELIGEKSAVLIGHSFGGNIALAVAQALPHQVLGVSTYETPLSWLPFWPNTTAGALASSSTPEEAAEKFMRRLIGNRRWDELPEKTKDARRREGPALSEELRTLRMSSPWDADAISCRVIAGYGSKAQPHHKDGAVWLARHLSHASNAVIEDAGHGAHNSHPQEFYELLVKPHLDTAGTFNETSRPKKVH